MEELIKKLQNLKEAFKKGMKNGGLGGVGSISSGAGLPNINKLPKVGHNSVSSKVKIPGMKPTSQKNPIKQVEQIQNKDIKDMKMKEAQSAFGIKKGESPTLYHIHQNGQRITDKPMSLSELHDKHGGVKKLENSGFRVIEHKPEQVSFKKNGQWELDDLDKSESKPNFQGDFHGQAHETTTERGERTVKYPKKNPDGSMGYGARKLPNKVKILHTWDNANKKWDHKSTTYVHNSEPAADTVRSPMDTAKEKMNTSNKKNEEKPKTIRRKLNDFKKNYGKE